MLRYVVRCYATLWQKKNMSTNSYGILDSNINKYYMYVKSYFDRELKQEEKIIMNRKLKNADIGYEMVVVRLVVNADIITVQLQKQNLNWKL